MFANFGDFLQNFATFSKNQLDSFVDLEKPEKMRIWLQNFVSIQPRTSLEKSDVSWPTAGPQGCGPLPRRAGHRAGLAPTFSPVQTQTGDTNEPVRSHGERSYFVAS